MASKPRKSKKPTKKPAAKKPTAKKLAAKKAAKKPAAKKPAKKPAAKKPAAKKPAKKKPAKPPEIGITPAEEARFWSLLEDAWATQSAAVNAARSALATREPGDEVDSAIVDDALDGVMASLRAVFTFADYPREELVAMDRVLERKLYDIDREDVHEATDGSDDGFLYARGFVVALGKAFYDAVNARPELAFDSECEEMCYLPAHIHEERFGEFPDTGSTISRESSSNPDGWSGD